MTRRGLAASSEVWMDASWNIAKAKYIHTVGDQTSLGEQLRLTGFNCYFRIDWVTVRVKCAFNPHHFERETLTM
jgi:hypothetical protein